MIAAIAVAGIFGATSRIINNNISSSQEVVASVGDDPGEVVWKKEQKNGVWYRVIYVHINSSWENGNQFGFGSSDSWFYQYTSTTYGTQKVKIGSSDSYSTSESIGDMAAKLYLPTDVQSIQLFTWTKDTQSRRSSVQNLVDGEYLSRVAFWVKEDNYNVYSVFGVEYDAGSESNGDWISEDLFFDRFYLTYVSVGSNWNSGNGNLTNFYVRCSYKSGTYVDEDDSSITWGYFNGDKVRGTKISSNMIHQMDTGKYYAEFLIPKDCNKFFLADAWDRSEGNSNTATAFTLSDTNNYYLVTNNSSPRTATYTVFAQSSFKLVGSGSFMSGTDWDYNYGKTMELSPGHNGALISQYLEEGDIFKITNGSDWYGWNYNESGTDTDHFEHTSYIDKAKTRATMGFNHSNCSWWADASQVTKVNLWGGGEGHGLVNELLNGPSGSIDIYTDNTTVKFERKDYSWNNTGDQTIPSNWSNENTFYLNSSGDGGTWGFDSNLGTNIRVTKTGYYNIYFNTSNTIWIEPGLYDEVYLDLNGIEWEGKEEWGYHHDIAAYFWNTSDASTAKCVKMTLVNIVDAETRTFEAIVPEFIGSDRPNRVIFYAYSTFYDNTMGTENVDWHKKTEDLKAGQNVYKLSGWGGADNISPGSWDGVISNEDRANLYGEYFQEHIGCDERGLTPPSTSKWTDLSTEYNQMCKNAQGEVWRAEANESGTDVEHAMATYDYIVFFKQYEGFNDFISRDDSPGKKISSAISVRGGFTAFTLNDESSFATLIIIVASSISLLSVTALSVLVIKKRKTK